MRAKTGGTHGGRGGLAASSVLRACVFSAWAGWAVLGCSSPGNRDSAPGLESVDSRYREAVREITSLVEEQRRAKAIPAISIALVSDQQTLWSAGFGEQDPDSGTLATSATIYRVGSVSKLFTDIAIMQLVERGELALDAPVTDYLPEFQPQNPFDRAVTLRQLMAHRSGLVREPPIGHYFDSDERSLADTVDSLNLTSLVYEPESRVKYSNAAIAVVGRVLEHTQATPFADYLSGQVLDPLGMMRTSFAPTPELRHDLAKALMWSYDGREFPAPTFELGMAPAGSMYASVDDLATFIRALFNDGQGDAGRVLTHSSLEEMWTPQFSPDPSARRGFGLGFALAELDGHRMIRHGGAIYGFSTELALLPEQKLGVVVASSMDFTNAVVGHIAQHALRRLVSAKTGQAAEESSSAATLSLTRSESESLSGLYAAQSEEPQASLIRLVSRGGRLSMHAGSREVELRRARGQLVTDSRLSMGVPVLVGGESVELDGVRYRRVEDRLPDDADPAYRQLIGEYGWDFNTLYILEDYGRLYALIEWFEKYPLTQIGTDRFSFPDEGGLYHGETLWFERADDGRVLAAVAGGVRFARREVGTAEGVTFKISPLRPIEALRAEAQKANPPSELMRGTRASDLVEPISFDDSIRLDIRYATENNFMDAAFYRQPRAFLQRPAAEALVRVHQSLTSQGYGLLIHDAYRPWYVTKMFFDATPQEQKIFVADPASGSRHNRGAAVDLTLYDLASGAPVRTTGGYDEFSNRSFPDYPGGTARQRWLRELLRRSMEAEGFSVYEFEWWHFDYQDWESYPVSNETFGQLGAEDVQH